MWDLNIIRRDICPLVDVKFLDEGGCGSRSCDSTNIYAASARFYGNF